MLTATAHRVDLSWLDDARCREIGGDLWFPDTGQSAAAAKRMCRSCPVQPACLAWAVATNPGSGVFGGLTARERRRLA